MHKGLLAAIVGLLGLVLGFGAGWAWENYGGGAEPVASPSAAASSDAA